MRVNSVSGMIKRAIKSKVTNHSIALLPQLTNQKIPSHHFLKSSFSNSLGINTKLSEYTENYQGTAQKIAQTFEAEASI